MAHFFKVFRFVILMVLAASFSAMAFPPAPPAVIFGKVRGKFGYSPEDGENKLLLLANGESVAVALIDDGGKIGENYRMTLPMDLNPSAGSYREAALSPEEPIVYSFAVEKDGNRLPISRIETQIEEGEGLVPDAGKITRYDFIIGEDTDQDGLPDDWERFQASLSGEVVDNPLELFSAKGDRDGDGLSDWDEYVAGTFALFFEDDLNFSVVQVFEDHSTQLSFLAVEGKSYVIEASTDMKTWKAVGFSREQNPSEVTKAFKSDNTNTLKVITEPAEDGAKVIYRLKVD